MSDIEIPFEKDRKGHYRFFEILPGALSWTLLFLPLILTFINVGAAVIFILLYLLIYFVRSVGYDIRAISGYKTMKHHLKLDWIGLNEDVELGKISDRKFERPKWHQINLDRREGFKKKYSPSEVIHAVIIATVNETFEVLELTIKSLLEGEYDTSKMLLVFAYEGRAGKNTEDRVNKLIEQYGGDFRDSLAYCHPANMPGEVIGKGGNISFAGRRLKEYLEEKSIDPEYVLITTLDADNRPDKKYFSALTYLFCVAPNPLRASYQPLPMFTNNIWDAPTMMRVIATGNNLFYIVLTKRPHLERNFSAHAQSMKSLIEMDFWSARTIVEDGHHFWRSYFHYEGDYRVYPISIPIYQDAVLADGYIRTLKAQFIQLRRWTYGASDIAYVADQGFFKKTKAPKKDVIAKFFRLLEGHVTWATGTVLVLGAAFIPAFFHPQNLAALELPNLVGDIQRIGIIGLLASLFICLATLPPRPARYKRHRSLLMLLQWGMLPVVGILYSTLAAFNSQTRLMFKRYLSKFDVTEHAMIDSQGKVISSSTDNS